MYKKYLDQLQERVTHIKVKKKAHINIWYFEFNWKITFNNKYQNYVHIHLHVA
jgi:hypothetical protein